MAQTAPHDGDRLRWWVEKEEKNVDAFLTKMGFETYSNLYYWYGKREIKLDQKEKFCKALGIAIEEWYTPPGAEEPEADYKIVTHQGAKLRKALEAKNTNLSSLAKNMKISRSTLYAWFESEEIDLPTYFAVSQATGIPVATLKGVAGGDRAFEKDIYQQLQRISTQNDLILQRLDSLAGA